MLFPHCKLIRSMLALGLGSVLVSASGSVLGLVSASGLESVSEWLSGSALGLGVGRAT